MSLVTDDSNYNAETRFLEQKVIIHFPGTSPLEITRDNYIIDTSILEEAHSMSGSAPFGGITSNEFDMTLLNEGGIFTPTNIDSPYYSKIRRGIRTEVFIRPRVEIDDEDAQYEWDPMGVFYITDWNALDLTAEVSAADALYHVLNGPVPSFPVYRNIPFNVFIKRYFAYFGYDVIVDSAIDIILPYVYTSSHVSNKTFLTDLLESVLADCFCDHNGNIKIISKLATENLRSTITDNDQIIKVQIKQSITNNYDSVTVTYNKCQESIEQPLIELADLNLSLGNNGTGKLTMSKRPVLSVRSLKTTCPEMAKVTTFNASATDFVGNIYSSAEMSTRLDITGTILDVLEVTVGEAIDAPLNIRSEFVQKEEQALSIKKYAEDYVNANLPTLELTIRGNPKFQIGDIIKVNSTKYKTEYVGMLIKANYKYEGYLSCTIILSNTGEV
jgi:hypothetical protein